MTDTPKPGDFVPKRPYHALSNSLFQATAFIAVIGLAFPHYLAIWGVELPWLSLALEFTSHLQLTLIVSTVLWLAMELMKRSPGVMRRVLLGVGSVVVAIAGTQTRASHLAPLEQAEKVYTAPFLVASLNVNVDNTNMKDAAQWAVVNRPDVMAFSEVSESQLVELRKSLKHMYKHEYKSATEGIFGMAVFSYYPIAGAQFINDEGDGQPMFVGKVMWDVEPVMLGVVHPMPPFTPELLKKRDAELLALAEGMGDGPAIIMGDFNATRYSTVMPKLGEKFGYAVKTPFYTVKPYLLDIDHVLLSKEHFLRTESNASIVDGSDHRLMWAMAILKDRNIPR